MVTVSQLMKRDLVTVDSGTSVIEAAKLMKACNVGSVLVSHDHQIIGIVTESDVVRKFVGSDKASYFIPVEDIMSCPIIGIEERRPLTEAADLMNRHQTHHLGVITNGGTVVGTLSVRDLLRPVAIDEFWPPTLLTSSLHAPSHPHQMRERRGPLLACFSDLADPT